MNQPRKSVLITFRYDPDEPEDHPVGMSQAEYDDLMNKIGELGAYDVDVEVVESVPTKHGSPKN
jgi:hypothetical protein